MTDRTYDIFARIMKERYSVSSLVGISIDEFRGEIRKMMDVKDGAMEGFWDDDKQRDLSIRFHWGHDHDFGDFKLAGRMEDRHLRIPAKFVDEFQALPVDMTGKRVLDVGVWTGGTSLLFSALGAEVVAIEEVKKYSNAVELLKRAFDIQNLTILNISLYDLNDRKFFDQFDYVLLSGVIYHVTDPVLALRIVFNALKDDGKCLIESYATNDEHCVLRYDGPSVFGSGSHEHLSRSGWNWFVPSRSALEHMLRDVGFQDVHVGPLEDSRTLAVALRRKHCDMLRAGLSLRSTR